MPQHHPGYSGFFPEYDSDCPEYTAESKSKSRSDALNRLRRKWKTDRGQLWIARSGRRTIHRLYCGDSTSDEEVSKLAGDREPELIFTSPPYAHQRKYQLEEFDWDELMQGVFSVCPAHQRTQILVNLGMVHMRGEWEPYWQDWIEWMRSQGWRRFGLYCWDKGPGLPGDWGGRLAPSFEFVFHFNRTSRKAEKWIPKKESSIKRNWERYFNFRNVDGSTDPVGSPEAYNNTHRIPDSVIRIAPHKSGGIASLHPAVFSTELAEFMIRSWPGLVYDPFAGSCTAAIAAAKQRQSSLSMEISPDYMAIGLERMERLGLAPRKVKVS